MRAEHLYIFGHEAGDNDGTIERSCDALFEMAQNKCNKVDWYIGTELRKSADGKPGAQLNCRIGIYIDVHAWQGKSQYPGGLKAAAIDIVKIIGQDRVGQIDKVVLIACGLAPKLDDIDYLEGGEIGLADGSDILNLMLQLQELGCRPVVCGYDCFVTIAPSNHIDEKEIHTQKNMNKKSAEWARVGQKVFGGAALYHTKAWGPKKFSVAQHKRTLQFSQSGRLKIWQGAGWSLDEA